MGIYKNAVVSYSIQIGPKALQRFHELKQYKDEDWIHPLGSDNWLLHLPKHGQAWLWPPIEAHYNNVVLQDDFSAPGDFWKVDPFQLEVMRNIIRAIAGSEDSKVLPEPAWWYYEGPDSSTLDGLKVDNPEVRKWKLVTGNPFGLRPSFCVPVSSMCGIC